MIGRPADRGLTNVLFPFSGRIKNHKFIHIQLHHSASLMLHHKYIKMQLQLHSSNTVSIHILIYTYLNCLYAIA